MAQGAQNTKQCSFDLAGTSARRRFEERLRKVQDEILATEYRASFPRQAIRRLVRRFWRMRTSRVGGSRRIRRCPRADNIPVQKTTAIEKDFVEVLVTLPFDDAAYQVSTSYASLLPKDTRARHGMFFTPPPIVDRLMELATDAGVNWKTARIIDPSCGGGAFLAPVVRRVVSGLLEADTKLDRAVAHIGESIHGIEIDPFLAWLSQVFVDLTLLDLGVNPRVDLPQLVTCADTLRTHRQFKSFDLTIGNPPYGRITLPPDVRSEFQESLYGHANLYGLFTHVGTRLLSESGVVAYVTPTSFLGGQYFQNLRRLLMEAAPPLAIDFIQDRNGVFDEVLQETALVVLQKGAKRTPTRVSFVRPESGGARCSVRPVGRFTVNSQPGSPWMLPRKPADISLLRRVLTRKSRLRDYGYSVATGPLVWNRRKEDLRAKAESGAFPLIWAESVRAKGEFSCDYVRRHHAPFFAIRPGEEHLLTKEPCVLLQRTTAKEQSRRLIAAVLPIGLISKFGAVVVENHLNIVRPWVHNGQQRLFPAVPSEVIAAVLNSEAVDQVFRCISGSVAVSAFELESLPLPDPDSISELAKILEEGASQSEIDQIIRAGYGLA